MFTLCMQTFHFSLEGIPGLANVSDQLVDQEWLSIGVLGTAIKWPSVC